MPRYLYRGKGTDLQVVEGVIEADNESSAIARLGNQGVFPVFIREATRQAASAAAKPAAARAATLGGSRRVSVRALAYTTRQLSDLLSGGLPLLSALGLLAKQTEHKVMARVIAQIEESVRDGRAFSDALSDHSDIFPPLYVSMVRAGEVGGGIDEVLARLADLGEHEAEQRSRLLSASAYPIFVMCIAFGMTIFLMTYVIPALSQVFIESGQMLPLPTRILLNISNFLTNWWWVCIIGLVSGCWLFNQWRTSALGKAMIDRLILRMPGFGTLVTQVDTARFARTLGVMLGQGVPVLQALEVVAQHVENMVLRGAVYEVQDEVRQGATIAAAMAATGVFPLFVSNMVAVGEESGKVDSSLVRVAVTYEREVDRTIRTLTTILEPVLLLIVGGLVMFIVLAMLLPIFQIGMVVQ